MPYTSGTSGTSGDKCDIVDLPHTEISASLMHTIYPESIFVEAMTISVNKKHTIVSEIKEMYLFVCDKFPWAGILVNDLKLIFV